MQTTMRKILSAVLVFVLCLGFVAPAAVPAAAEEAKLTEVAAWNLVLADEIAVNFYVSISNAAAEDAVMQVTDGYGTAEYPIAEAEKNAEGQYLFTARLAAAQMSDSITLQLISGEEAGPVHSYSAVQYANAVLSGDYGDETKALIQAMLHYGAAAQLYFGYNTENLANAGLEAAEAIQLPEAPATVASGKVSGIAYYGASLLYQSRVAVRFYFDVTGDIEGYTFSTENGKTYAPVAKDGRYYVDVPGINPQDYDKNITLTVSDGRDSLNVSYSPVTYIVRKSVSGSESLKALVAAMYGYNVAAEAYLSANGHVSTDGNGIVTEQVVLKGTQSSAVVAAGTQLEENTNVLTLSATPMSETTSDVVLAENEKLVSLDVHVEGIAKSNTVPVIVTLDELAPEFLNKGNISLFHVENGETVEMTRVYSAAELDAHNEYYYDIVTGTVTVALASFSEIAVRSNTENYWNGEYDYSWYDASKSEFVIANADQLVTFSAIVGGMEGNTADSFNSKTVKLIADIKIGDTESENGRVFYPIGYYNNTGKYDKFDGKATVDGAEVAVVSGFKTFEGTFDGQGHTISDFYQNTWEMFGDYNDGYTDTPNHYRDGMGLFGKVYGGTVKNLTVKNFSSDGEFTTTGTIAAYADCGATFENIAIFNCNPRVYNIGNGGIVGCVGWYANTTEVENPVTFTNVTVDNTNKITALWGSWDVACGGLVGQYYPTSGQSNAIKNKGIHIDNCHVAAQIDVYNDVCANYQYYAYRYAGMLIGSIRENVKGEDGRVYPDTTGITATNCTVHYDTWNDYYYCELVANSLASYTHDHQMSRLEQVASVNGTTVTPLEGEDFTVPATGRYNYVVVNGEHATENATCYHFVDGEVWDHEKAGYEDGIDEDGDGNVDLKEDKQHLYLPFAQLFTGYSWGVTSAGLSDYEGITVKHVDQKDSVDKFDVKVDASATQYTGLTITLGDLFKVDKGGIQDATVQAFVSPVGEDSTATATYTVVNENNWKENTLTFSGKGAAEIIITDYNYCIATTFAINVENPVVRYWDCDSVSSVECGDAGVILPVADAKDGKTFIGWSETEIGKTDDLSEKKIFKAGETYYANEAKADLYAVYSYTESGTKTYTLVTDAADLAAGDVVVIVAAGSDVAMSTTQNGNNRGQIAVTKNGNTLTVNDSVQLLTLEAGTTDGTFAFYTGSGYLYAASSSSNYLRTQTTNNANGSWMITIDANGVATVKAQGSNTRNWLRYNSTNNPPIFSCYGSGQTDISIYKETSAAGGSGTYYETDWTECGHTNTNEIRVEATCQKEGSVTVFCNDCREQVGETEILPISGHSYVDGTCTVCGETKSGEWKIVENVNELNIGDKVIIVAAESDVAMSTEQKSNNRGQASVIKDTANGSVEIGADVQILILEKGNKENTFAFYTENGTTTGYLYAASSGSNYLRTEANLSDNSSWAIAIADGVATVTAQGTNTHNLMQYNSTNSLFASYESAQKDISIYRWAVYCNHDGEYTTETVAPTCTEAGFSYKICANCGTHFDITAGEDATNHNYAAEITTPAGCETTGVKTFTCSVCNHSYTEEIAATGHTTEAGVCENCDETIGATPTDPVVVATFALGANGSASHYDGSSKTSYSDTVDGYTLALTNCSNMYTGARDAKGNSCIKLGASSKAGGFSFTVGDEITSVVIYIAKYKANTTKVSINGTTYTISGGSNDGAYDAIEVDTTTNKTVTITTVSGGYRAMVNTIEFKK